MKILLTIHEKLTANAGAAGCTIKLGEEYKKKGHQVSFFSFDNLPSYLPDLAKEVFFPEFVANHISKLIKTEGLDVVDGSTGDLWFWAKHLCHFHSQQPLLVTRSHGLENLWHIELLEDVQLGDNTLSWKYYFYRGSVQLWEVKNSLKYADIAYLLNHQEKKYSVEKLDIPEDKIKVFANGIPDSFLNLPFKVTPQEPNSIIRIAQIGTYIPRKGIQYGQPAIENILTKYPQVEITFFGTACKECPSEDIIYRDFNPQLWNRIKVVPRYDHATLPNLLKDYQIKLFPTLREGFSLGLLEAMACGLAPISTAHHAALEIIRDGQTGIIVPLRNSKAIEKALIKLIEDKNYLASLRQNAYNTAQQYSWKKIAQDNINLYIEGLLTKQNFSIDI